MGMETDTRGWIMACVSGIACTIGASIICVDVLVQLFPGKRNFRIEDSSVFLSASMSLSFGVMLFSAIYGMLPSAGRYLKDAGYSPRAAAYTLIGCFLLGVIAISGFSSLLHHYIPTHIIDCDHTHSIDDKTDTDGLEHDENGHHRRLHHLEHEYSHLHSRKHTHDQSDAVATSTERSPLLSSGIDGSHGQYTYSEPEDMEGQASTQEHPRVVGLTRISSFHFRLPRSVSTLVSKVKPSCDESGPCHGFSDPCGQQCFNHIQQKTELLRSGILRSATAPQFQRQPLQGTFDGLGEEATFDRTTVPATEFNLSMTGSRQRLPSHGEQQNGPSEDSHRFSHPYREPRKTSFSSSHIHHDTPPHHHHVPANAFLSIGLQTSIAIALHKLPEGFITYATNHANPQLGLAVFMALFIHNVTEGFAMALPLYLALKSRWKAMFWSTLLGGLSQPAGAAVAALWFKLAGDGKMQPGEAVYGIMFSVTAGIMTSVGLQLFSEALSTNHNRTLCITFAFIGMGILGVSFALTAE